MLQAYCVPCDTHLISTSQFLSVLKRLRKSLRDPLQVAQFCVNHVEPVLTLSWHSPPQLPPSNPRGLSCTSWPRAGSADVIHWPFPALTSSVFKLAHEYFTSIPGENNPLPGYVRPLLQSLGHGSLAIYETCDSARPPSSSPRNQ